MRIALLRYFNPVGAHASGTIGEDPSDIPNNLMPYIAQVAVGRRDKLSVFGDDYDTPDGTGVRDYIHVEDLAAGHVAALEALTTTDGARQRLEPRLRPRHQRPRAAARLREGRRPRAALRGRRRAAPATSRRRTPTRPRPTRELGWRTTRSVEEMCADTWRWQSQNPEGYDELMLAALGLVAAAALLPLAGTTVVVDPGHQLGNAHFPAEINRPVPAGGFTKPCNTTGTATDGGYPEATFAWQVSRRLRARLGRPRRHRGDDPHQQPRRPLGAVRRRPRAGRQPASHADLKVSIHGDGSYAAGARGFHVIAPASRAGVDRRHRRALDGPGPLRAGRAGARRGAGGQLRRRRRRARRPLRPRPPSTSPTSRP